MSAFRTVAVGLYSDRDEVRRVLFELRQAAFKDSQIGLVTRDAEGTVTADSVEEAPDHLGDGAVAGATAGVGLGALWGWAVVAGLLPAIGPAIAGGALVSILASAATGAAALGLTGALLGMGIPEEEARHYEEQLQAGRTVVTVQAGDRYEEACVILQRFDTRETPVESTETVLLA